MMKSAGFVFSERRNSQFSRTAWTSCCQAAGGSRVHQASATGPA